MLPTYLAGLMCGLFLGAMLWEVLYAGPLYRKTREREHRLDDRVRAWQRMYLHAEGARIATSKAIYTATHPDDDRYSKKVPDLKAVQ